MAKMPFPPKEKAPFPPTKGKAPMPAKKPAKGKKKC